MKIKQVEDLVGISRKNIRFYEEQGLLSPNRAENGYREYDESDVLQLKQIKFLRKLNIPISEIQKLLAGKITPAECFQSHLVALAQAENDLRQARMITQYALEQAAETIDHLCIDDCLKDMDAKEKEGTRFMDLNQHDVHRKKSLGAILGGGVMILLMGLVIWLILWANAQDPLPPIMLLFILALPTAVVFGVAAVLIQRLREIKGGEEDDAAQY